MCIIIGDVRQFIGHCLIPLDPCIMILVKVLAEKDELISAGRDKVVIIWNLKNGNNFIIN